MTREEALDVLKRNYPSKCFEDLCNAVDIAIKTLSAPTIDNISRQAAKDALDGICDRECEYSKKQRAVMCASCHLGSAFDAIDELPSIDPVKHGKWIKNEGRCGWHCSACATDDVYAFEWNSDKGENELQDHYCPNCGALMDMSEDV